jgi:hypothetical protein
MCIVKQAKAVQQAEQVTQQTVPEPTASADPTPVGAGRKEEDNSLFGGVPDLRVDRPTTVNTPAAVGSSGAGLNLM